MAETDNLDLPAPRWLPDVLVIGPGGLKGFAELGALQKLDEENYLDNIHTVIGVSIGSIIGLLYVCGFNFKEITEIGMKVDLFKNYDLNIMEVLQNKGFIKHDIIRDPLVLALLSKVGMVPTLEDVYNLYDKNFITVSYDLRMKEPVYFNRISAPDMKITDAALASSSIPFVFQEFVYKDNIYFDGAIGNPYPVNITEGSNVLGLYISDNSPTDVNKVGSYISTLMYAPINELRKEIINTASPNCRHLELCIKLDDISGLNVSESKRREIFETGYQIATTFIAKLKDEK